MSTYLETVSTNKIVAAAQHGMVNEVSFFIACGASNLEEARFKAVQKKKDIEEAIRLIDVEIGKKLRNGDK